MFEILHESTAQKEKFRNASNKLLNHCFLLKKKEDTKADYMFVLQNIELFEPYFELLGYRLQVNKDQGVIGLLNQYGQGRLQLNKYESIMLLIFRLLYVEKRKELGVYSEEVIVLMEEVREKYAMLKVRSKLHLEKGMEKSIVSLFRRYNLIKNIESDVTLSDTRIIIYPSITLALAIDDMNQYYEMTQNRLRDYAGGEDLANVQEDLDESTTN
ncbi:MAG: DUF4194 domain-containing protein [Eubacteriales bacterium]